MLSIFLFVENDVKSNFSINLISLIKLFLEDPSLLVSCQCVSAYLPAELKFFDEEKIRYKKVSHLMDQTGKKISSKHGP